ncbi:MAG: hypothetical protein KJ623_00640 [Nanoarchaeota archaeon]|nr:hypothetical protein [Nanoarchaeota archaeon]MBU0963087.1 hypothetical protein [Nanoarchaeota archaeon]
MVEVQFSRLKKECPKCAEELVVDQELLLSFLNSPIRKKVMKFAKLNKKDINSIMEIVEHYAKLKIEQEKKLKEKTSKEILKIEVSILKNMFIAEVLEFKKLKIEDLLNVAKSILQVEYPDSVILNMLETDKIATLLGIDTNKKFPSELLVFDSKNKKIIGVKIINK